MKNFRLIIFESYSFGHFQKRFRNNYVRNSYSMVMIAVFEEVRRFILHTQVLGYYLYYFKPFGSHDFKPHFGKV